MGRAFCSPPAAIAAACLWLSVALLASCASALTAEDFYPFGADNGDTVLRKCTSTPSCYGALIPLPSSVPVFGVSNVRGFYINPNGALHFQYSHTGGIPVNEFPVQQAVYRMVAGFWTELFKTCPDCGEIMYRIVNTTAGLADINTGLREAFPNEQLAASFSATTAIIATWDKVWTGFRCCQPRDESVTFQIVVAFNRDTTFIFLLYADSPYANTGSPAQAGFNVGDGVRGYSLPGSRQTTATVSSGTRKGSNIGQPGKWCFGLSATQTIGAIPYLGPPGGYSVPACDYIGLRGDGGVDMCNRPRTLNWDVDNDGTFATFNSKYNAFPADYPADLRPGTYTVRARASSSLPCAASPNPIIVSATVTVTGPAQPVIRTLYAVTQAGNNRAYVGERVVVRADTVKLACRPSNLTINCGPDYVTTGAACQYNSPGEKHVTAKLEQDGFVATATLVIIVNAVSLGGPYEMEACASLAVRAGVGLDACGKQRVLKWDFDNDGAFDDPTGSNATLNNAVLGLSRGVHTVRVEASSSPACAASPPEVRSTTVNITTTPPAIVSVRASTLSYGANSSIATTRENITVVTVSRVQACLPNTETVDCGPGNVGNSAAGICQYTSTGVKTITVTLEQFGLMVAQSISISVTGLIIKGGPYRVDVCYPLRLFAVASVDACGRARSLAWDLDNDGVFNDAVGANPPAASPVDLGLNPGVHPISVRATSQSSCPDSPPEVVQTTVTVTRTPLEINTVYAIPDTPINLNGAKIIASVRERVRVQVSSTAVYCSPDNFAVDCGPDSERIDPNEYSIAYCIYNSPGVKTLTATIAQFGTVVSNTQTFTVTTFEMGGPYHSRTCDNYYIYFRAPTTIDACGRERTLAWDFDNDSAFDDATGNTPRLNINLIPGVHPIHVQSSSNPACPASPTPQVNTVNVTITANPPQLAINSISAYPRSDNPEASVGEEVNVYVSSSEIVCLPYNRTSDCGADGVIVSDRGAFYDCRYTAPGEKVITATLTQLGVTVSLSRNITIIAAATIGGPYFMSVCGGTFITASGGLDECGNPRTLAWDLDDDGAFDDAIGSEEGPAGLYYFSAANYQLRPGKYTIRVRASSNDTAACPNAVPVILTTSVTIEGGIPRPEVSRVYTFPESGNKNAAIGEGILILDTDNKISCIPYNITIDCGQDSVGNRTGYCQYTTRGVKLITVTLSQEGFEGSRSINVTVISTKPSCATAAYPEGRVLGRRGCLARHWSTNYLACHRPDDVKPYTKLYNFFASRAEEDAQLIQRYFGNRTIYEALRISSPRRVDSFAMEATAALLNAQTLYYAQCPLSVKHDFRNGLYNASNTTALNEAIQKFSVQNYGAAGCPFSLVSSCRL